MQWFSSNTRGHIVVMGSNTWLDHKMPKPLPERHCVVVTNKEQNLFTEAHDVIVGSALLQSLTVLEAQHPNKTVWIIGGAKLINSTKELLQEIHLTTFYDNYNCDVAINVIELLQPFQMQHESYGKNKIFSVWKRAKL